MRTKKRSSRKNKRPSIGSHLTKLGFNTVDDYRQWCQLNGFSIRDDKDEFDLRSELVHSLTSGPNWDRVGNHNYRTQICLQGTHSELLDSLFSNQLTSNHRVPARYRSLQRALSEIRGPRFEKHANYLRAILEQCEKHRVRLFEYSGKPLANVRNRTFADALALVAAHGDDWIRPIKSWRPTGGSLRDAFRNLTEHLFALYEVPAFWPWCWFQDDFSEHPRLFQIFKHLAGGNNLRSLGLGIAYSKRMAHQFHQAPEFYTFWQAIRWGQVVALGGSTELANRLSNTLLGRGIENWEFWQSVVLWFINHSEFPSSEIGLVLDYVNNQRFGVGNFFRFSRDRYGQLQRQRIEISQPNFEMKGRTTGSLLRDAFEWQESRLAYGSGTDFVWESSRIQPFHQTIDGIEYEIFELLGNGALADEGYSMSHCVSSYADACAKGSSTIWSLQEICLGRKRRMLTIEVNATAGEILQARGYCNRNPREFEMELLRSWCRQTNLRMPAVENQEEV